MSKDEIAPNNTPRIPSGNSRIPAAFWELTDVLVDIACNKRGATCAFGEDEHTKHSDMHRRENMSAE